MADAEKSSLRKKYWIAIAVTVFTGALVVVLANQVGQHQSHSDSKNHAAQTADKGQMSDSAKGKISEVVKEKAVADSSRIVAEQTGESESEVRQFLTQHIAPLFEDAKKVVAVSKSADIAFPQMEQAFIGRVQERLVQVFKEEGRKSETVDVGVVVSRLVSEVKTEEDKEEKSEDVLPVIASLLNNEKAQGKKLLSEEFKIKKQQILSFYRESLGIDTGTVSLNKKNFARLDWVLDGLGDLSYETRVELEGIVEQENHRMFQVVDEGLSKRLYDRIDEYIKCLEEHY